MAVADVFPSVVAQIQNMARQRPQSVAVDGPDGSLTYEALVQRAGLVAERLAAEGVGAGTVVGHWADRSAAAVVGALGILTAGCAYICIDPAHPDERIRWMLTDADAAAVVVDRANAARVDAAGPAPVALDALDDPVDGQAGLRGRAPGPTDPAYVVYTSGSTGQPKGALVEHAGLANLAAWHRDTFGVGPGDRCSQIASPGFDASVWETWPTLAAGATLVLAPEQLRRDPRELRSWLTAERVTVAFAPTPVAEAMLRLAWPAGSSLRYLLAGGDRLSQRPPADLPFVLVNNYGVSEASVVTTSGPVASDGPGIPTLGQPISGVTVEVLGEDGAPVEDGESGELVIVGTSVARGYVGDAALTAARFGDGPGGRRYRTGDLVRRTVTGELEFLGRSDDQLSIRGYRVEPAEVVAALDAHPSVSASAAAVVGAEGGERLMAYVVADPDHGDAATHLAEDLAARLPAHLVPAGYVWIDELPITVNGKIDRAALAALDAGVPRGGAERPGAPAAGRAPQGDTEEGIASMLSTLLDVPAIAADEDFFALGGHSLLAAQLVARIEERWDVEISLRTVFDRPTVAGLAGAVDEQIAERPLLDA